MMRRSINAWFFEASTPVVEMARRCAAAGFEALELVLENEGVLTPQTDQATCRSYGQQVRDAGLHVASLATGLFWQTHYGSDDPETRQKAYDLTLSILDRAAWLGAEAILVIPAVVGAWNAATPSVRYADALNRSFETLHRLAYEAEQRGVILAVENVWNRFLLSPVELADLIDRVNSPWVGAYLDVGNVLAFGFPQDWIDTLGRRIVRVHLKDYDLSNPGIEGFCPLGEGSVDWPAVMAALSRAGYDGPLTYEGRGDLADIKVRMDRILSLLAS